MSQPLPPSGIEWWSLFDVFLFIGITAGAIVVGLMVYYSYHNRYKRGQPPLEVKPALFRSRAREAVTFASISAILLFSLAVGSYRLTTSIQYPPATSESLVIDVTAFQWNFMFHYPNNVTAVGECRVPSEKPIIFNVTSIDVMHNFGLPDFKIKIDAIPGRYNILWITTPPLDGNSQQNYTIRCYELCGSGHTYMIGTLMVMDPNLFNQWLISAASNQTGGA